MSAMRWIVGSLALTTLLASFMAASAKAPRLPDDPRDVPREVQLTTTEMRADLDGDGEQEVLLAVNALTGESDPAVGSEVLFGIAAPPRGGARGPLLWSKRVHAATGKPAHDGEMAAVDLDGDGRSEVILSWDRSLSGTRVDRWAEIWVFPSASRPVRAWEGWWERDTRRDKDVADAHREWARREVDFGATRRGVGKGIGFKTVIAVEKGLKLDTPRTEAEWVPVDLRPAAR